MSAGAQRSENRPEEGRHGSTMHLGDFLAIAVQSDDAANPRAQAKPVQELVRRADDRKLPEGCHRPERGRVDGASASALLSIGPDDEQAAHSERGLVPTVTDAQGNRR